MNDELFVARTIMQQLGGTQFVVMTNARWMPDGKNGVFIKFKGSRKANRMSIKLNGKDLYDVKFYRVWGDKTSVVDEMNDAFAETLRPHFESVTGLRTKLFN